MKRKEFEKLFYEGSVTVYYFNANTMRVVEAKITDYTIRYTRDEFGKENASTFLFKIGSAVYGGTPFPVGKIKSNRGPICYWKKSDAVAEQKEYIKDCIIDMKAEIREMDGDISYYMACIPKIKKDKKELEAKIKKLQELL